MSESVSASESASESAAASGVARRVPSRGWYGLAAVVLLIGASAFSASLGVARAQVQGRLAEMIRVVVPGEAQLELTRAGRHLVYYERMGVVGDEQIDTRERFAALPKMNVDLYGPDGVRVPLTRSSDTEAQMFNGGMASSEWEFESPAAGTYRMTAAHSNPIEDRVLLAVGPPVADGVLSAWTGPFGGASVLAFSFVFAAIVTLVTWALRRGDVTPRED